MVEDLPHTLCQAHFLVLPSFTLKREVPGVEAGPPRSGCLFLAQKLLHLVSQNQNTGCISKGENPLVFAYLQL